MHVRNHTVPLLRNFDYHALFLPRSAIFLYALLWFLRTHPFLSRTIVPRGQTLLPCTSLCRTEARPFRGSFFWLASCNQQTIPPRTHLRAPKSVKEKDSHIKAISFPASCLIVQLTDLLLPVHPTVYGEEQPYQCLTFPGTFFLLASCNQQPIPPCTILLRAYRER
jgi:hypothetical protein